MRTALTATLISTAAVAALSGGLRASVTTDGPRSPKANVVTVTAVDYAFQAPDTIAAGRTTLRLVNKGKDFHHIWLIKLEGGHTLPELVEAAKKQGPMPTWAVDVGGPNSPMPGGENSATLDLEPGAYVMVCVIPAMADGQPHFMKGMMKQLTVAPRRGVEQAGKTVAPTSEAFQAAAANADWKSQPGYGVILANQPGDGSWPMTAATWILIYKKAPDAVATGEALKFFAWSYGKGQDMAKELDYVPMPANVVADIQKMWNAEIKDANGKPLFALTQ